MAVIWKRLPAAEAIDALADGSLPSIVPTTSGIYIWRRNFDCDPRVVASADSFTRWITDITRSPVAVVERKPLTHCVDLVGLIVGGGLISADKQATLEEIAANRKLREKVATYIASISMYLPPIYIGQADSFLTRIRQHLKGETSLKEYVENQLGLQLADLLFCYHELSKSTSVSAKTKQVQQFFEFISQRLLAPFGTKRPG